MFMKKPKWFLISLSFVIFIVGLIIVSKCNKSQREQEKVQQSIVALETTLAQYQKDVRLLCQEYNFDNVNLNLAYIPQDDRLFMDNIRKRYDLTISIEDYIISDYSTVFNFVKAIENMRLESDEAYVLSSILINEHHYFVFGTNDNELWESDSNKYERCVFTYLTSDEKSLASNMPFVGMLEKYIGYTILGKPNEYEKCIDFNALKDSHKSATYRWFYSSGKLKAVASISYWDWSKKQKVEPYISDFSYFD